MFCLSKQPREKANHVKMRPHNDHEATSARHLPRVDHHNSVMVHCSGYKKPPTKKGPSPKTSRREMTNVEKGMVIAFFYCLQNITLVVQTIGQPWTTIKSFLARVC